MIDYNVIMYNNIYFHAYLISIFFNIITVQTPSASL